MLGFLNGCVLVAMILLSSSAWAIKKGEATPSTGGWVSYGVEFDGHNMSACTLYYLYDKRRGGIQGEVHDGVCTIDVPRNVSSERFDGCYLSGIQLNGDAIYGCNVREIDGSWFFRAGYRGKPGAISCEFMCRVK